MADITFDKVNALPDFLTNSEYVLDFSKLPNIPGISADDINGRTISVTPPKAAINKLTTTIRGFKKHQPTTRNPEESITITVVETVDAKMLTFIKAWRDLCSARNTHAVSSKEDREAEILLYLKSNTKSDVWAYKIINVWLEDTNAPELGDGESPEAINLEMTLSFGDFIDGATI